MKDGKNKGKIVFDVPEGFVVPEGTEQGGEFEALAKLRLEYDDSMDKATLCLVSIDGSDVSSYDKEEETEEEYPEDMTFGEVVSKKMKG